MIMMLGWFGRFRTFMMMFRRLRMFMRMMMNRTGRNPILTIAIPKYTTTFHMQFIRVKLDKKRLLRTINNLCGAGEIRTLVQTRNQSAFYMFIFAFDCREQARPKPPTWTLSSKISSNARGVRQTISDIAAPPYRNASEQQHPGDVTSRNFCRD